MQELFKNLKPDAFEDIIAAVALYRPGPLGSGMVKDFVDCKHGRKPIEKMHPLVDELLAPTYGVIVYQEQVMQVAQRLAGYTLGGADLLRRAMGKKKPEEMAKQKATFVDGSLANGVKHRGRRAHLRAARVLRRLRLQQEPLGRVRPAHLPDRVPQGALPGRVPLRADDRRPRQDREGRAHHRRGPRLGRRHPPARDQRVPHRLHRRLRAAANGAPYKRKKGSKVNDALDPKIRFGLGAIRGVGDSALLAVLEARDSGGPFSDLFDFAQRVDPKRVNKGVFEALVQCGAFDDSLRTRGVTRARAFASIDRALERSRRASKDREGGQTDIFGLFAKAAPAATANGTARLEEYPQVEPWDLRENLVREKQSLGFYVSGHPLDRYGVELSRFGVDSTGALAGMKPWSQVKVAGVVDGYREKIFKGGGGKVAFFILEDQSGRVEVKVRQAQIETYAHVLTGTEPVLVSGKVQFPQQDEGEEADAGPREPTVLLDDAVPIADAIRAQTKQVTIRVSEQRDRREHIDRLRDVLRQSPGACAVQLVVQLKDGSEAVLALGREYRVEPSDGMLARLEKLFGEKVAELR